MKFLKFALGITVAVSAFAAEVPRTAPELAVLLPGGGQQLLSQYRGKVVCVEMLFTTCPHCQETSRMLSRMVTEYGPKGFQAIGVAFNPMSHMLVKDFVRDHRVNFPVGYQTREAVASFLGYSPEEMLHVPQIVFVDKKGRVRVQSLPRGDSKTAAEQNVRQTIEMLLKEPAAVSTKPARKASKKTS